jgi:F0F1-type ATP synthase assembly protein I
MFRLYVLQTQWIIMALLGGIAALLYVVLAYIGMWRPREPETAAPQRTWSDTMRFLPWFLIITFIATAVFNIGYCIYIYFYPPNW